MEKTGSNEATLSGSEVMMQISNTAKLNAGSAGHQLHRVDRSFQCLPSCLQ